MRGLPLMTSMPLENWLLFYTHRNADVAHSLLQTLNKVSEPMGIRLQRPGIRQCFCLQPKLTVLVVKKRSSSRFFTLLDARLSNPPPGTVIDAEVT
ncbi:hypothetical protein AMELA_G00292820 [Ameiurus melas]|uniref:Uncharacterized protein n=1 Tax=Ameiurus melas TaxID=219545 RepID=A0A7J5ZIF7_AMEME|nr:hypothetical protein AMELA_G00292820 [Ameiurus melas]